MPPASAPLQVAAYRFQSRSLIVEALTHRSFGTPNNERLEFLGDSVLNFAIADALFRKFPDCREGALSRMRAQLVRQDMLARLARSMGLGAELRLGDGERKSGGHDRDSILADAFEALVGAISIDGGVETARSWVLERFAQELAKLDESNPTKDPKTTLQEFLQARRMTLPEYRVVQTRGQEHAQEFDVECVLDWHGIRCSGSGPSRRAAEQAAASEALRQIDAMERA